MSEMQNYSLPWKVSSPNLIPPTLPVIPSVDSGFYQRLVTYKTIMLPDGSYSSVAEGEDFYLSNQTLI